MPARFARSPTPTILLVDDDDVLRRACTIALRQADFFVLTASDGTTALELVSALAEPPDALIIDMRLSDMSGTTLVRRAGISAPVLYVSGDERALRLAHMVCRSSDAVLAKPFTAAALVSQIARMIGGAIDPEPEVA